MEIILAKEFNTSVSIIKNIITLIDAGNTIPFIARYRKEMTGAMDDQILREVADRLAYLRNLESRKEEVVSAIDQLGKLSEELRLNITNAKTLSEIEDIYRPFKAKRRTRAMIAREQGLEPLADFLYKQEKTDKTAEQFATQFLNDDINTVDAAILGAMDIIAENISDDANLRKVLRNLLYSRGLLVSVATKDEDSVYRTYYEFSQSVSKIPAHRILAINRGEKEGYLKVKVDIEFENMLNPILNNIVRRNSSTEQYVVSAATDSLKRLIFPSLEREIRNELTEKASEQAIKMFGQNLAPTLMQPPLHDKVVLGFDPAYRTGCKIAVVDRTGKVLDTNVVYPTPPNNKTEEAKQVLLGLIKKHGVEVIAIGNGTASKESEIFVAKMLKEITGVSYIMVNEAGASVYSASKLGAQEFPDFDVSLRSAVSIARRLQDPMAELVKIDPKAIGVGQYQHDMQVKQLDNALSGVVESCVNSVGVNINTASPSLLSYVAGITATTAKNICTFREENGKFTSRTQIKKVQKLGPKAYEQCAGFLRIPEGKQILDNTAVHPEAYSAVGKLMQLFGYTDKDIKNGNLSDLCVKVAEKGEQEVANICEIGIHTLKDIVEELQKPGRDIRENLAKPQLREDVFDISDLTPGMEFVGTVRNVIDFGAFVDIGVHQDGLVHISKMADKYVSHPSEVAKVGDIVTVWVLQVDVEKKRISLSMIKEK